MSDKQRVTLEFSQEAYNQLDTLRDAAGVSSNAEVFQNALRLYDFLLQNRRDGWAVHLVKGDAVKELELLVNG